MKGELLPSSEGDALLGQAVDIARRQHSRALERRVEAVIEQRILRTVARTVRERPSA
jgi:hypothetical protein